METAIKIDNLDKSYKNEEKALTKINLEIHKGEIFALLGPNGAGKSTLINIICGMVNKTQGGVSIFGYDIEKDYRKTRSLIGLVPQEITTDSFETVFNTIKFSRGLFNKPESNKYLELILKSLSLFEKKDAQIRTLSGGMKRRVMIAKALSHEPKILFLDEPTAGVDVELRKSMWNEVNNLKKLGVTIFLTTHYIEEAEKMADRIGIINKGKLIIVEQKKKLVNKLGKKQIIFFLKKKITKIPSELKSFKLKISNNNKLIFNYDAKNNENITYLFELLRNKKIEYYDIEVVKNSLEEIFVELIKK